jgi:hypothetical protein
MVPIGLRKLLPILLIVVDGVHRTMGSSTAKATTASSDAGSTWKGS